MGPPWQGVTARLSSWRKKVQRNRAGEKRRMEWTSTSAPGGVAGVDGKAGWYCKVRGRQDEEVERGYGEVQKP
jgi:hypothetical protein